MDKTIKQLRRQFTRAAISRKDFEEAQTYLLTLATIQPPPIQRGLMTASVVAYARPFIVNRSDPESEATGTLLGNMQKVLPGGLYDLHTKILSLRNTAVAHSDYEANSLTIHDLSDPGYITRMPSFDLLSEVGDIDEFRRLCEVAKMYCVRLTFQIKDSILEPR